MIMCYDLRKKRKTVPQTDTAGGGSSRNGRNIDIQMTGKLLHLRMKRAGLSVKQLQTVLGLECPQSIYRWFYGQALPSVENLYVLHRVFDCSMENLLVTRDRPGMVRCAAYLTALL